MTARELTGTRTECTVCAMRQISIVIVVIALQGCSVFLSEDTDDDSSTSNNGTLDAGIDASDIGSDADAGNNGAGDAANNGGNNGVCPDSCPTPNATCDGTAAVLSYSAGEMGADCQCTFTLTRTPCDEGTLCENGACTDPCDGVECVAPLPYCAGETYIVFAPAECAVTEGEPSCNHANTRTNCTVDQVCIGGDSGGCRTRCQANEDCSAGEVCDTEAEPAHCISINGLCDGVFCPAETCSDPSTLATYPAAGTCNPETGACEYAGETTAFSCPDANCSDGVCVVQCGGEPCYPDARCEGDEDAECVDIECVEGDATSCGDSRSVCIGGFCRFGCNPDNNGRDCPASTREGAVVCDPLNYCMYGG